MILLPAIDLLDGQCVRLRRGDFDTAHRVAADPLETARSFEQAGAAWIHMVDLDGARTGSAQNQEIILRIARETSLLVEAGGGIRDMDTVAYYLQNGVSRVVLGSAALENPQLVKKAVEQYGSRVAVGIDAKNGMVATEGWLEKSDVSYLDLGLAMEDAGVKTIIFTDISRDGTLTGVNTEQLGRLNETVSCNIIASGGVSSIKDIEDCLELNLYGCICGKALYTGALNLEEAVRKAGVQTC